MKNISIAICSVFLMYATTSLGQNGLIAHWKLNGNAADSSGNGLHGIAHNTTNATGINGQSNTAYYFDGSDAYVGVPYNSLMNMPTGFTISTVAQPQGFNNGTCQANVLLYRGHENSQGFYGMEMFDNTFDGNDCSAFDSTLFVFAGLGPNAFPITQWQYTPTIQSFTWYRVSITFKTDTFKVYVNGQLKSVSHTVSSNVGNSMDSLVIGRNYSNLVNYPYYFKGLIDDMKLYNHALSDTEIINEGCEASIMAGLPDTTSAIVSSNVNIMVNTMGNNLSYQWQINTGSGFTNIINTTQYLGINTAALTVVTPSASMNHYQYRCIVTNAVACKDTSTASTLKITTSTSISNINLANAVSVLPNPSKGIFTININTALSAQAQAVIFDLAGRKLTSFPVYSGINSCRVDLAAGIYKLYITDPSSSRYCIINLAITP